MQIKQKTNLEELAKEKWVYKFTFGESCAVYGRDGIRLAYDTKTQTIVTMYDTNLIREQEKK